MTERAVADRWPVAARCSTPSPSPLALPSLLRFGRRPAARPCVALRSIPFHSASNSQLKNELLKKEREKKEGPEFEAACMRFSSSIGIHLVASPSRRLLGGGGGRSFRFGAAQIRGTVVAL